MAAEGAVEVWRGGVNTWQCDEMGHMNVRFYVAKAQEALAGLARELELPHAFAAGAPSTLIVDAHHVRFLKEAHAGAALSMTGMVLAMGEDDAHLVFVLHHGDGAPCASFRTRVTHATPDGRRFPWPARARRAAERLTGEAPPHAQPRSIGEDDAPTRASLARAAELGLACIGRGAIDLPAVDVFGRMRADEFIGRVSDGVPFLLADVRKRLAEREEGPARRVGGAVLEYRLRYFDFPRVGDHIELRSGLKDFDEKTQRLVHWMLDPVSGKPWGAAEAVAVNFDLDTRKAVPISPVAREALAERVVEGLSL